MAVTIILNLAIELRNNSSGYFQVVIKLPCTYWIFGGNRKAPSKLRRSRFYFPKKLWSQFVESSIAVIVNSILPPPLLWKWYVKSQAFMWAKIMWLSVPLRMEEKSHLVLESFSENFQLSLCPDQSLQICMFTSARVHPPFNSASKKLEF